MRGRRTIALAGLLIVGCSEEYMVQVVRQPDAPMLTQRAEGCLLTVYREAEPVPAGCREVGDVFVGDSGATSNCAAPRTLDEVRRQACLFGADAAQVVRVHPASFTGSSCDQIRARLPVCETRETRQ